MGMSPATSLASGLVYFKDILKFHLGDTVSVVSKEASKPAARALTDSVPTLEVAPLPGFELGAGNNSDSAHSTSSLTPSISDSEISTPESTSFKPLTALSIAKQTFAGKKI